MYTARTHRRRRRLFAEQLARADLAHVHVARLRSPGEAVYKRSRAMLERAAARGSFALGTGNSVPEYIEDEKYFAMTRAAVGE